MLAIFFLPLIGGLAYLVIGRAQLPQERREIHATTMQRLAQSPANPQDVVVEEPRPPWARPVAQMMQNIGATPLLGANDVELVLRFDQQLTRMVEAVDAARQVLHIQFCTLSKDASTAPFFDPVARARGVDVRVLADHLGPVRYPGWKDTVRALEEAGVTWCLALPVRPLRGRYQRPDPRNHRKIVVVDHEAALVSSMNLIDPSHQKRSHLRKGLRWVGSLVRLQGPVAAAVEAIFATDWLSETGQVPPMPSSPPAPRGEAAVQVVPSGPGSTARSDDHVSALRGSPRPAERGLRWPGTARRSATPGAAQRASAAPNLFVAGAALTPKATTLTATASVPAAKSRGSVTPSSRQ